MAHQYFRRGSGCFRCAVCNRNTRITTQSVNHLCAECYDLAGLENARLDGCLTIADLPEINRLIESAIAKGGDEAAMRSEFSELFSGGGVI